MEYKKVPSKKAVKKVESVFKEIEKKYPVRKEPPMHVGKILHCLFIGNGASVLYSLSVLSVIYGLVGILTPLFCVKNVLNDKLICIGTLQGYEIMLLFAAIIPFVKKKITNDAVSLILFIAMFLVVGAITLDTISNYGFTLSTAIGILWSEGFLENRYVYVCPSSDIKFDPESAKLTEENTAYCFRGGLTEASSVDSALAWDKPNNHDKYGNILYVDGHVKGYAGANWMDNIK